MLTQTQSLLSEMHQTRIEKALENSTDSGVKIVYRGVCSCEWEGPYRDSHRAAGDNEWMHRYYISVGEVSGGPNGRYGTPT